jgi:hypothetical protein
MNILKDTALVIIIGIFIGLLTSFGQTYIPAPFTQLANSYSVWLFASFIIGYVTKSYWTAGIGGAVVQYIAIAVYYVISAIRFDSGFMISSNIVWLIGGTVAGPIIGVLAYALRHEERLRAYAIPALTSLFLSESVYQFINLGYVAEGIMFAGVGVVIGTFLVMTKKPQLLQTVALTVGMTALMYGFYGVILTKLFS